MSRRIDLGWQARWEMLKIFLGRAERGGGIVGAFSKQLLSRMSDLEKTDRPCLSRATKEYRSPMTGDRRAIWGPLPVLPELPEERDALEVKE